MEEGRESILDLPPEFDESSPNPIPSNSSVSPPSVIGFPAEQVEGLGKDFDLDEFIRAGLYTN